MARKRPISRRTSKLGVWQSLNQPIAYPTQDFANTVFFIAALLFFIVWIAPYWGMVNQHKELGIMNYGRVAGISTFEPVVAPDWYYTGTAAATGVKDAVVQAGTEIFDISEPVQQTLEFYQPGAGAAWNAWLELMADP